MKRPSRPLLPLLALLACATFAGCARHEDHAPAAGGHTHQAPHGGKLVELGEHAYNLELVRDAATGTLTAYLLDGHAENFVRIAAPALALTTTAGGQARPLTLAAVANPATGETVGNTSQFEARADWLKTAGEIAGEVAPIEIRGTRFGPVKFQVK